jgi:predicted MFS family arabinose efflux permease
MNFFIAGGLVCMASDTPFLTLARTRSVRRLLVASLAGRLTLPFFGIGLLVDAHAITASYSAAGVVTGAYGISIALGGPALGRMVDRRGQTGILVGAAIASAMLLLVFALLPHGVNWLVLVLLASAIGLATPPLIPCTRSLLPTVVADRELLGVAYAVDASATEASWLIGPPLGLAVAAAWSPAAALAIGGLVLLVGTAVFAFQPAARDHRPPAGPGGRPGSALRSGSVRRLAVVAAGVGLLFGAAELGVTAVATAAGGTAAAAPLLGLWGGGGLLGGIIASRLERGSAQRRTLVAVLLALAAGHLALTLTTHSLVLTAGVLLVAGLTIAPVYTAIYARVHSAASETTLTEAFAWIAAATALGNALGSAMAGTLLQDVGPSAVFAFAGLAGVLAAGIAALGDATVVDTRECCTVPTS